MVGLQCKMIAEVLVKCVDDRTVNHKGDVGSLVRIAAVKSVGAWTCHDGLSYAGAQRTPLIANFCHLLTEKLDKVRTIVAHTLVRCKPYFDANDFDDAVVW